MYEHEERLLERRCLTMVAEIKAPINPNAVLRYGNIFLWINRPLARLGDHVLLGVRHNMGGICDLRQLCQHATPNCVEGVVIYFHSGFHDGREGLPPFRV